MEIQSLCDWDAGKKRGSRSQRNLRSDIATKNVECWAKQKNCRLKPLFFFFKKTQYTQMVVWSQHSFSIWLHLSQGMGSPHPSVSSYLEERNWMHLLQTRCLAGTELGQSPTNQQAEVGWDVCPKLGRIHKDFFSIFWMNDEWNGFSCSPGTASIVITMSAVECECHHLQLEIYLI